MARLAVSVQVRADIIDVRYWHKADISTELRDVRYWGQSGHHFEKSGHSSRTSTSPGPLPKTDCHAYDVFGWSSERGEWDMTRKSIKTSAQETIVAAGKSAAEGTKTLVGELAQAATAAATTAAATATAAPGAVWDKVATTIGAKKPRSRKKKKVAKKVASKKRTTLRKKANKKKASRRSAKKKRL